MVEVTANGVYGFISTLDDNDQWTSSSVQTVSESETGWEIGTTSGTLRIDSVETIGEEDPFQHIAPWERALARQIYPLHTITWRRARAMWQEKPISIIVREHRPSN